MVTVDAWPRENSKTFERKLVRVRPPLPAPFTSRSQPAGKSQFSPLTSRQFGFEAPPGEIRAVDQRLEVIGQRRNDGVENLRFEKGLAGLVLLQQCNVR